MYVELMRDGAQTGHKEQVWVTASAQESAGQPLDGIMEGDEVNVVRYAGKNAIVKANKELANSTSDTMGQRPPSSSKRAAREEEELHKNHVAPTQMNEVKRMHFTHNPKTFDREALFRFQAKDHATFASMFKMGSQNAFGQDILLTVGQTIGGIGRLFVPLTNYFMPGHHYESIWFNVKEEEEQVQVLLRGAQPDRNTPGPEIAEWLFPQSTPFFLVFEQVCSGLRDV